jgi:hypothetical protein
MIAWPSTLPQRPNQEGWSDGEGDARLRTPQEAGPVKQRLLFSYMPEPLTLVYEMTYAQRELFRAFYKTTAGGTLPFTIPNPLGAGTWIVQFNEGLPRYTPRGIRWLVSLDLVRLP